MPTSNGPTDPGDDRMNELYWNTTRTIGDITEELGVSRNALYTSIQPFPAGASCPECNERMVFTNRTQRDTGMATCRACGAERDTRESTARRKEPAGAAAGRARNGVSGVDGDGEETAGGWTRWRDDLASVEPERYALVGGAAALGVMLGAAAARALRHRM
jgi:Zn ribbon nucleic-acid-binding protein